MSDLLEFGVWDAILVVTVGYVIYRLFIKKTSTPDLPPPPPRLPPLKMKDMTLEELSEFDGVKNERVLLAVLGNIYDVTRGKDFYGPGGPYAPLAGHDATRPLATYDLKDVRQAYDDLEGLTQDDLNDAKGWDDQFNGKYDFIGHLLKPGESPKDYEGKNATVGGR